RSTIPGDTAAAEQFADEHPELATFVRQVSTARSRTAQLGPDWPRTAKAIYTANQRVLVDDTDPAEACDEAARTVDASRTDSGPRSRHDPHHSSARRTDRRTSHRGSLGRAPTGPPPRSPDALCVHRAGRPLHARLLRLPDREEPR